MAARIAVSTLLAALIAAPALVLMAPVRPGQSAPRSEGEFMAYSPSRAVRQLEDGHGFDARLRQAGTAASNGSSATLCWLSTGLATAGPASQVGPGQPAVVPEEE